MCCNSILALLALIAGFGAIIYLIYQTYSYIRCGCGKYGPFVSSYGKIKEDIINEARKILKNSKKPLKITDLGCGSGALLIPLAKEFPHHEFIGLDWDVVPLMMGKIKSHGLKNIKFVKGDYMKTSHADMDLIMCYVLKVTGEPLGKKLNAEIKDSCTVISEMFPLGHLKEVKQINSSLFGVPEKIFIYKKQKAASKETQPEKKTKTAPQKAKPAQTARKKPAKKKAASSAKK
ncbi:MAG: methyltransferase domain-containing protein [Alphaproteobacteria bacterium]|nr:methyltransferase domain-containing protein [Alphaproteobacteria bacterium]